MDLREYFKDRNLLTNGKSNTKTAKNETPTYYISLQPTDLNTKKENLCKFSTKECRTACLQFAGRQSFGNVVESRSRKTELFVNDKPYFVDKLWGELVKLDGKGKKIAVRLNLLSDVDWETQFKTTNPEYDLNKLNHLQLYDYTKDHFKIVSNGLRNYNLTFSYSGHNWNHCEKFLKEKLANVAVVFKNVVPLEWRGYKVINGDQTDERFLEEKGVIIGLKYKVPHGVKYEKNKFVVDE
jgi:hypothetical protein